MKKRDSGAARSEVLPGFQPGMLWRVRILRDFLSSGRYIQSRSTKSLVEEAEQLAQRKDFKGYIHDVGGPTANFTRLSCKKAEERVCAQSGGACRPSPART